ncbi:trypsin-like serine protease [Stigmatella sp. ncwal1]|uniref:Trypsin-like serine protease n=1 Tax=Stigmatella ashevillensis TaxID=2995309 RepID=A0ABT5DGR8_9BACT|nr:trypsin-like serine protease [Stigmatella ashevillena]MDC0712325.1 trypsin-like serine protease [Stigmatella ashevillena]
MSNSVTVSAVSNPLTRRKSWALIASMGAALAAGCGPEAAPQAEATLGEASQEIVGGTTAAITDFPWQISFQSSSGSHFCGGSIINANWVLTAQHCVYEAANSPSHPSTVRVGAGSATRTAQVQISQIADIIPYPGYSDATLGKDVALLRLATPLTLNGSTVKAIPLATAADVTAGRTNAGVTSTVTGWGTTSSGSSTLPSTLLKVDVPIVSNATASTNYGMTISADQIAAGFAAGGKDSCQGDSGGPLVVNGASGKILAGVVSWGEGCALPNYPGLYARVSSFEPWISGIITKTPSSLLSQTGAAAGAKAWKHYTITVPSGVSALTVSASGGTGDADLYVHTTTPTTSAYTCRPYAGGNTEYCSIGSPRAGTWYVSLYGYSAASGITLKATAY